MFAVGEQIGKCGYGLVLNGTKDAVVNFLLACITGKGSLIYTYSW
jgi:hypothetical protein